MTDLIWTPASDDDPSVTITTTTAHNTLPGRSTAGAHPASAVTYDPTASGLSADTVQDAIDEVAAGGGGGAVDSVNGQIGVVVLDAGDVSAVPNDAAGLLPGETNRGTWDIAETYAVGDVVVGPGGDLYVATAPSTGAQPPLTPGSWDLVDPTGRHIHLGPGATSGEGGTAVGLGATSGDYGLSVGPVATSGTGGLSVGTVATSGEGGTAVGAGATSGDWGLSVGPGATSGDYGLSVGPAATSGDYGLSVGPAATSGDYGVNIANIYRGTLDPGDPTVPTGATIATGFVDLPETADVTNPPADHQRLVARTDGLYVRDETGTEVGPLGAGGAVEPGMVPPVSPSAYDQEYWDMADGSPVVGTWHNQGTSTAAISDGRLLMTCQAVASGYNQRALLITLPSFTSVTTRITVGGELANHSNAGLVLYNSGTGRILQWLVHLHGSGKDLEMHRANSFTSFDFATLTTGLPAGVGHVYLKLTSDGVNLRRWVSDDGDRWIMVGSVTLASWIGSVTGAGVVVGQEHAGIAVTASFDFLRFT